MIALVMEIVLHLVCVLATMDTLVLIVVPVCRIF